MLLHHGLVNVLWCCMTNFVRCPSLGAFVCLYVCPLAITIFYAIYCKFTLNHDQFLVMIRCYDVKFGILFFESGRINRSACRLRNVWHVSLPLWYEYIFRFRVLNTIYFSEQKLESSIFIWSICQCCLSNIANVAFWPISSFAFN